MCTNWAWQTYWLVATNGCGTLDVANWNLWSTKCISTKICELSIHKNIALQKIWHCIVCMYKQRVCKIKTSTCGDGNSKSDQSKNDTTIILHNPKTLCHIFNTCYFYQVQNFTIVMSISCACCFLKCFWL